MNHVEVDCLYHESGLLSMQAGIWLYSVWFTLLGFFTDVKPFYQDKWSGKYDKLNAYCVRKEMVSGSCWRSKSFIRYSFHLSWKTDSKDQRKNNNHSGKKEAMTKVQGWGERASPAGVKVHLSPQKSSSANGGRCHHDRESGKRPSQLCL